MGLGVARGRISGFPIDLRHRPYNTLAIPCECVIGAYSMPRRTFAYVNGKQSG